MNDLQSILDTLKREMDYELETYFHHAPMDRTFRPKLDFFLRQWEEKFAPYVILKFDYRIDGQHLDINATIPQLPKFVIDMRRRGLTVLDLARDF